MEQVFKKADISQGINVEHLTKLRFASDVALFNKKKTQNKWKNH